MQKLLDKITQDFGQFEQQMNGVSTTDFHQVRKAAFASLTSMGFPVGKAEEYKFTPLTKSIEKNFAENSSTLNGEVTEAQIADIKIAGDHLSIVMVNGCFRPDLSDTTDAMILLPLWDAYEQYPAEVMSHFGKYAEADKDAFLAWNTAFSKNGLFLKVDKNSAVEKAIIVYHITTEEEALVSAQSRNLILLGESSKLRMAEIYRSLGHQENFTNMVSEIVLDKNARMEYTKVQNDHDKTYHYGLTQVYQARDSHFTANTITLDGAMIRNNINIVLDAENCEAHMYGIYLLKGKTHVDNHTAVDHRKPNSFSNELYKGILDEKSRGVFNGKVFVRREAQKTNAFQSNNNILLTGDATVNSKPQLEIWADDVKCSHGCTVGQLDEEAIFYFRARGIDEKSAKALLLFAFAKDTLQNVSIEPLQAYLEEAISKRLHTHG